MRLVPVVALLVAPVFAEVWGGVQAGVRATQPVETWGEIGGFPFRATASFGHAGPALGAALRNGFGFKVAAIYSRFTQSAGQLSVTEEPGVPFRAGLIPYSKTAASWEFPLLGCFERAKAGAAPYVEAGVTLNRLGSVLAPFRTLPSSSIRVPPASNEFRVGATFGAGVAFRTAGFQIAPGFRFTRYSSPQPWVPASNAAVGVLDFGFRLR